MINKFYKNKQVLVTGATGFKGAWLCFWLNMLGSKVYGIGNNPSKKKNLFYYLKLDKKITLKFFDIRNRNKLKFFVNSNKVQIIFHLAAQPLVIESYKKPYSTYEINTMGTLNVLETVRQANTVKSVICVTSYQCYENDLSTKTFKESDRLGGKDPYSASKASAEIIIKSYQESFFKNKKCGIASARVANVIGGGDWAKNRLIPDVIKSIVKNKAISIRNPNFIRPWLHILEPIYGYLILGEKLFNNPKKYSGPWNFGTKKNNIANVLKIVNEIIEYWGKGNTIFRYPFQNFLRFIDI